jgi:putative SOS response-associated peptidase YedK
VPQEQGTESWSTQTMQMPILDRDSYDVWLDPGITNVQVILEMLKPYDARLMRCYPVSTRINHVLNDEEECSHAVELAQNQQTLFGQAVP